MHIIKMHGLGNDFILADNRDGALEHPQAAALALCHRRLGVGADGLILIEGSQRADLTMRIFNSDGSEAEMCGNGIRCFARLAAERIITDSDDFAVETLAGIMRPHILRDEHGAVAAVRVDMGAPSFDCADIPLAAEGSGLRRRVEAAQESYEISCVLMGVPHGIVLVDDLQNVDIARVGAAIETAPLFPRRINVNFVQRLSPGCVRMRTWERGCGATMACGTGASACVSVLTELGLCDGRLEVQLEAGSLFLERTPETVYMTGPAALVFEGETDIAG